MCQLVARMPQLKWLVLPVKHVHNTITNFTVKSTSWVLDKRTPKLTQVFNFLWTSFSFVYPFALTFGLTQIHTQVDAHFSLFGHPTQVDTSWSQSNLSMKFITFCYLGDKPTHKSVWLPITSPYMQVSWFCKLVSTCIDLRVCLVRTLHRTFHSYLGHLKFMQATAARIFSLAV